MGRYRCLFSFYGGKSKLAQLYPEPIHDLIIEPFAGGGAYSLRHCEKNVLLNDLDTKVYQIWKFVLSKNALDICLHYIPKTIKKGTKVSQILPSYVHLGLLYLLQAEANRGTQGARGVHDQVTTLGYSCWDRLRPRLKYWMNKIKHWKITNSSYENISNQNATWYIDPPYNNEAGRRYRECNIDYSKLADWVKTRKGQVIVCENKGAKWLPFKHVTQRRGIRSRYQKSTAIEVMYYQINGKEVRL